jgi:hypothetical protein
VALTSPMTSSSRLTCTVSTCTTVFGSASIGTTEESGDTNVPSADRNRCGVGCQRLWEQRREAPWARNTMPSSMGDEADPTDETCLRHAGERDVEYAVSEACGADPLQLAVRKAGADRARGAANQWRSPQQGAGYRLGVRACRR